MRQIPRLFLRGVGVIVLLMFSFCGTAKADAIFSNLGPGGTFQMSGFGITGSSFTAGHVLAAQFVPNFNFLFTDASLALSVNQGTAAADVFLMTDASGLPATILEQFTVTGLQPTPDGLLFTVDSTLQPLLAAGKPYWLAVTAADSTSSISWRRDSTNDLNSATNLASNIINSSLSGPWNFLFSADSTARPAFEVDGTPVPEPTSALLLIFGLMVIGLLSRIREKKRRHCHALLK